MLVFNEDMTCERNLRWWFTRDPKPQESVPREDGIENILGSLVCKLSSYCTRGDLLHVYDISCNFHNATRIVCYSLYLSCLCSMKT